jgi:ATP-binding cassette subfamily B protein
LAGDKPTLYRLLATYGGLTLVQAAGVLCFVYLAGVLGERVRYDLRQKMFNHLQGLSLSYFSRTPVGWIMSRVTSDSERVAELVTWGILDSTWAVMNILTAMGFMLYINWRMALIVLAALPILFWIAVEFLQRILVNSAMCEDNSKITGCVQ